ncbi:hypothetical protein N7493_010109 [Penicillium malachiteum]|uniref:Uncharacterized protein n=1 Tax=Penicillium malachiteum TaxID=1324776 RepID=A0AAD6HCG0_9EURO|nr:hypothetical protein N7493_010109 [Penicillium malachiteum]
MQATSHDRDWSILPKDELFDQATDLPLSFKLDTTKAHQLLDDKADFGVWLRNITRHLKSLELEKLLDIQVPRPLRDSPHAARWYEFSCKISNWLVINISNELMQQILARGNRVKLADEFIHEATTQFQTPGIYADLAGVEKFISMKPSAYATTKEFVSQFLKMMMEYWTTQKIRIHPYFALCHLLIQLDTVKNKSVFASIITHLKEKAAHCDMWTHFTFAEFQATCHNIMERLEERPKPLPIAPPPTVPQHWPPLGVNLHEYAKMLRETLPQFTEDKTCAHCGYKFHIAARCHYLNPETRPSFWVPVKGIWMYEPRKLDADGHVVTSPTVHSPSVVGTPFNASLTVDKPSDAGPTADAPSIGDMTIDNLSDVVQAVPGPSIGSPIFGDENVVGQSQASIKQAENTPATDEKPQDTSNDGSVQAVVFGKRSEDRMRFGPPLIDIVTNRAPRGKPWVLIQGSTPHVCIDKSAFAEYHEFDPNDKIYEDKSLTYVHGIVRSRPLGWGKVNLEVVLTDGTLKELMLNCHYFEGPKVNIFFTDRAALDLAIYWDKEDGIIRDNDGNEVACMVQVNEKKFEYLRTPSFY